MHSMMYFKQIGYSDHNSLGKQNPAEGNNIYYESSAPCSDFCIGSGFKAYNT